MQPSDENYPMRRFIASGMKDEDILSLIITMQEMMDSLKKDEYSQYEQTVMEISKGFAVDSEEVKRIAIIETKKAMIPFFDEFESRHKN